jgi:hypothetical protein
MSSKMYVCMTMSRMCRTACVTEHTPGCIDRTARHTPSHAARAAWHTHTYSCSASLYLGDDARARNRREPPFGVTVAAKLNPACGVVVTTATSAWDHRSRRVYLAAGGAPSSSSFQHSASQVTVALAAPLLTNASARSPLDSGLPHTFVQFADPGLHGRARSPPSSRRPTLKPEPGLFAPGCTLS